MTSSAALTIFLPSSTRSTALPRKMSKVLLTWGLEQPGRTNLVSLRYDLIDKGLARLKDRLDGQKSSYTFGSKRLTKYRYLSRIYREFSLFWNWKWRSSQKACRRQVWNCSSSCAYLATPTWMTALVSSDWMVAADFCIVLGRSETKPLGSVSKVRLIWNVMWGSSWSEMLCGGLQWESSWRKMP